MVATTTKSLRNKSAGIRVLFVLGNFNQGGAERQALYLAQWLKENLQATVSFYAFSGPGAVTDELDRLGISWKTIDFSFYFINHYKKNTFSKESLSYRLKLRQQRKMFAAAIDTFAPDIVLPYTYYPNVVCGMSWRFSRARACVWNQRDIGNDGITGYVPEKIALNETSFFLSNSSQGADLLQRMLHVDRRKIQVIHNGIVVPQQSPRRAEEFGLSSHKRKVVMLANFHPFKDQETLVRAWHLVLSEHPQINAELVLAGRFAGTEKHLMMLCEKLGIRDHVVFLDSVKDVYGLLSVCELSAFSSVKEGNPNAVLEAMASGLAVVATDIDGCREVLGNDYPFLSQPGNAAAMKSNILRLLLDPDLSREIGIRNKLRIQQEFSIDRMGEAYVRIFETLL